jgi:truncated hemoglobin YjbI
MDSIYDRYGDRDFWNKLINDFYQITITDPVLKVYFAGRDIDRIKNMHSCLLNVAFKRSGEHFPYSVKRVHKSLEITDDVFERYIMLYEISLRDYGIEENDIESIVGIMYSFKWDLVPE